MTNLEGVGGLSDWRARTWTIKGEKEWYDSVGVGRGEERVRNVFSIIWDFLIWKI